jgi:diguanylate cyclase (GGDEF)-like protein/PAS domain S-box-containing protein
LPAVSVARDREGPVRALPIRCSVARSASAARPYGKTEPPNEDELGGPLRAPLVTLPEPDRAAGIATLDAPVTPHPAGRRADTAPAGSALVSKVLERLATDAPLDEILERLTHELEGAHPGVLACVSLLDEPTCRLRVAAARSLPREYGGAIDGVVIGPNAGSCGTAAYRRKRVIVGDIETDPLWTGYRHLALRHGLRACWSQPILGAGGRVLGTLAMYHRGRRSPGPAELAAIGDAANLASIAIEHKYSRQRIARLTDLYRARSEISRIIVRTDSEAELLPDVCRVAVEFGGMHMAWIGTADPATGLVSPVARHGSETEYIDGITIAARADRDEGRGPVGQAFRNGDCVIIEDVESNPCMEPWRERARRTGFRCVGCFAIARGGGTFAVLAVYSVHAGAFDAEAIGLLRQICRDVGYALDAIDRAHDRQKALADLHRSEQDLREKNQFLNSILQCEPECVKVVGLDGHLLQMNAAGLRMLGVASVDEVREVGLFNFVVPKDRSAFERLHAAVCQGGSGVLEFQIEARDGVVRWLETHATPLRDAQGVIGGVLGITRDLTDRKASAELIWKQANFDRLTALPNRYMLQDRLGQEIKKAVRAGTAVALLIIDLDDFKEINDTLGHETGDAVLVAVAQRIASCVRESDTVARLGGDEFAVILPQPRGQGTADHTAQAIITRLGEAFSVRAEKIVLSASVGIACFPADDRTVEGLLKNADQAMYVAKRQGRNRVGHFTPRLQEEARNRLRLINDLRAALPGDQFRAHFQPIVELRTGRIRGAEALLRWQHPDRGMVSPGDFIPLAEETGLIIDIGDWVLREAARWAKRWSDRFGGDFPVSVNNSPVQFRERDRILSWAPFLREIGLAGRNVTIEITEGLLLDGDASTADLLHRLHEEGMRVAIDDFGTGYSSLSYLHKFRIDSLKIDQSFVRNLQTESSAQALCESIIVMAHKLGLSVVAEGVETPDQRDFLVAAGCDFAQGFLYSRPLPAHEFDALLGTGV